MLVSPYCLEVLVVKTPLVDSIPYSLMVHGRIDQNRVGGSDRSIREQVRQQKTRYQLGGSKQAIRERVIGGSKQSGSESRGASNQGER